MTAARDIQLTTSKVFSVGRGGRAYHSDATKHCEETKVEGAHCFCESTVLGRLIVRGLQRKRYEVPTV